MLCYAKICCVVLFCVVLCCVVLFLFVLSCRNGTKVGVVVFLFVLSCRNGTIGVLWFVSLHRKGTSIGVIIFLFLLSCRKAGVTLRRKGITFGVIVFLFVFLFVLSCRNGTTVRFCRSCCRFRRRSVVKDFKNLLPRIEVLFAIKENLTVSLEWGSGGKALVS